MFVDVLYNNSNNDNNNRYYLGYFKNLQNNNV